MKKSESQKDIIEELSRKTDRKKTSIYISQKVWNDFKKVCKNASPSVVLEHLMKEFIEKRK